MCATCNQNLHIMKRPLLTTLFALLLTSGFAQTLDTIRELSELNTVGESDAYPYITGDGLRLYFTNNASGTNNLYYTSRPDIYSPFAAKQLVDASMFQGINSCWLTNDELEIYYSNSASLYHATRASTLTPFGTPTLINLVGGTGGFLNGPSLTPGAEELYVYEWPYKIYKYNYTSPATYTLADSIMPPVGYEAATGQLSRDGLEYFYGLSPLTSDSVHLNRMSRAAIGDDFGSSTPFNNSINGPATYNIQPSYASTANVLVWVRSDADSWSANELYVAHGSALELFDIDANAISVNVFPNPTTGTANIQLELKSQSDVRFFVTDRMGKVVQSFNRTYASGMVQEQVDLRDASEGMYYLTIQIGEDAETIKLVKMN